MDSRDVLMSIFKHLDWISLATASWVSKNWKESANYLLRNFSSDEWIPKFCLDENIEKELKERKRKKRWEAPKETFSSIKPFSHQPFILGKLLGIGGSSRVFQLGNLSDVCIKICCGGSYVLGEGGCKCKSLFQHSSDRSPCKKLDQIVLDSDEAVLQAIYIWASQTSEVAMRLCREHLNGMLRDEFELLEESNKASSPLKSKLFPRVFAIGMEANRTFIVMERVEGITLRKVLSSSFVQKPLVENSHLQVDFLAEVLEIIEALLQLSREIKFWHGDLKPENMIVSYTNNKLNIRCIDPVPRHLDDFGVLPVRGVATIAYNPKMYLETYADVFGLLLIMYELYTAEQPFKKYKRLEFDGEEDKRPLSETLMPSRKKQSNDKFALWLIDTMQNKSTNLKQLKQSLEQFQKNGQKIIRYVPEALFTPKVQEKCVV